MTLPSHSESSLTIHAIKDQLFQFYYDLSSEVKGKPIEITPEEYEENVNYTSIPTLFQYIKSILQALVNKKVSEKENEVLQQQMKQQGIDVLENQLRKYEADIRYLTKKQFQYKTQLEGLEIRLVSYMEMEESFEEMKEKLKYEEGKFLDNDKKDNEIFILRAENSKLKDVIAKLEHDKKSIETASKNDKEMIIELKKEIQSLAMKINKLEQNQIDFNSNSNNNSSINININNNGNSSSQWVIKHEEINPKRHKQSIKQRDNDNITTPQQPHTLRHSRLPRHNNYGCYSSNSDRTKVFVEPPPAFNSTYNKILSEFSHKKNGTNRYTSRKLNMHQKNNSATMNIDNSKKLEIVQRYLSNNKRGNGHCMKITNFIPNMKFPVSNRASSHHSGKQMIASASKLYLNSTRGNKTSNNRSSLSVRSNSRGPH